jgi:hypothetical protein
MPSMMQFAIDGETREFLLDDERLRRFIDRLRTGNRVSVRLPEIWASFAAVYTDLPEGPQRRLWLLTVLEELEQAERIALPVSHGRLWDRTSGIALPSTIRLSRHQSNGSGFDWKRHPWHPKLQWVLQRRHIGAGDIEFLLRVNQGLVEGWFEEKEPFKYRSLQLTGDEKRLTTLAGCALFGAGKLSLEMLGCEPEVLPLAMARVSMEPTMLLFENAAPFMVARNVVPQVSKMRVGYLGYGAGKQLLKSVGYFSMIEPPLRNILYVGDLDAEGIQIASAVSRKSRCVPVQPATLFHLAMFEAAAILGSSDGWPVKDEQAGDLSETALEYLDLEVRGRASKLIKTGRRIPEEVISHSCMRQLLQSF